MRALTADIDGGDLERSFTPRNDGEQPARLAAHVTVDDVHLRHLPAGVVVARAVAPGGQRALQVGRVLARQVREKATLGTSTA